MSAAEGWTETSANRAAWLQLAESHKYLESPDPQVSALQAIAYALLALYKEQKAHHRATD